MYWLSWSQKMRRLFAAVSSACSIPSMIPRDLSDRNWNPVTTPPWGHSNWRPHWPQLAYELVINFFPFISSPGLAQKNWIPFRAVLSPVILCVTRSVFNLIPITNVSVGHLSQIPHSPQLVTLGDSSTASQLLIAKIAVKNNTGNIFTVHCPSTITDCDYVAWIMRVDHFKRPSMSAATFEFTNSS